MAALLAASPASTSSSLLPNSSPSVAARSLYGISSRPPSVRSVTSRYRYVWLPLSALAGGANDEIASATATATMMAGTNVRRRT